MKLLIAFSFFVLSYTLLLLNRKTRINNGMSKTYIYTADKIYDNKTNPTSKNQLFFVSLKNTELEIIKIMERLEKPKNMYHIYKSILSKTCPKINGIIKNIKKYKTEKVNNTFFLSIFCIKL